MTNYNRIAAVTGANKGIGLAIVRQLALQYPKSSFNNGPLLIYLTARNEERGKAALESINADPALQKAKVLSTHGGLTDVKYLPLDIDSQESIQDFATTLKKQHPDGIDILVNNAAVAFSGFDIDITRKTLHCNYYGTLAATLSLLPLIRPGGRLVNVASMAGRLSEKFSDSNKSRFRNAKSYSDITELMEEFTTAVENDNYQGHFPGAAYAVSKAGVIGITRVIAADHAAKGGKVLVNACCPGYVKTDMTRGGGSKTVDEGAQTPVLLALGDIKGANGEFWQSEKRQDW